MTYLQDIHGRLVEKGDLVRRAYSTGSAWSKVIHQPEENCYYVITGYYNHSGNNYVKVLSLANMKVTTFINRAFILVQKYG